MLQMNFSDMSEIANAEEWKDIPEEVKEQCFRLAKVEVDVAIEYVHMNGIIVQKQILAQVLRQMFHVRPLY